jgi:hypothetical protein
LKFVRKYALLLENNNSVINPYKKHPLYNKYR